jgi:hypothetical protein
MDQPAHLQAGVQVAPGLHWQLGPHLQAGPQAQGFALPVSPVEADAGTTRWLVVFM